jgi:general secretion pathway protein D
VLGSIPILGVLFRYKSDKTVKKNLMVFLRPTIIRSLDDSFRVTSDRYDILKLQSDKFIKEQNKEIDRMHPVPPGTFSRKRSQDSDKKETEKKEAEEKEKEKEAEDKESAVNNEGEESPAEL